MHTNHRVSLAACPPPARAVCARSKMHLQFLMGVARIIDDDDSDDEVDSLDSYDNDGEEDNSEEDDDDEPLPHDGSDLTLW